MKLTEITSEKNSEKIMRLAAYCRVSTDSDDQLHSFAAQVRYYESYADSRDEFELVDIYADEGLSGTDMKKRDEMNRMIRDCEKGKIDYIIVKSVSRFARNTQDLISTIRLLKSLNVTVFFEEQNIDTSKLNSEMFLTFPGMMAQQESESISGNVRWGIQKSMESGNYTPHTPPYGYDMSDQELVVNEQQAKIIRRVFEMYLSGFGKQCIADTFNNEGIQSPGGNTKWYHTTISYILNNERYMGDALLQKRFRTNTLPYTRKMNRGELAKYYVEESNPAIVTKETYQFAQNLQKKREVHSGDKKHEHFLSHTLFCPECGRAFRRLVSRGIPYWVCSGANSYTNQCKPRRIREDVVYDTFSILIYKLKYNNKRILGEMIKQFQNMLSHNKDIQDVIGEIDHEIAKLSAQLQAIAKLHNAKILNSADYTAQSSVINQKITSLRIQRRKAISENEDDEILEQLRTLYRLIEECIPSPELDETLFKDIIERIIVVSSDNLEFHLIGDLCLTESTNTGMGCKIA